MSQCRRNRIDIHLRTALGLALLVGACVSDPGPATTQPASTTLPAPTKTTERDRCPHPFCVVYHIRPEAQWSDGVAVTASDFIHTYEIQAGADGYSLISGYESIDDKTVSFSFSQLYGPWQTLFDVVVPAHVDDPLSVSAGPFLLAELGEGVGLARNPAYWSSVDPVSRDPLGDVARIDLVPTESVRAALRSLTSGDLHLVQLPSLDWVLEDLSEIGGVAHLVAGGPVWEQVAFNFDDELLSQPWLRQAVNLAIDRTAIVDATVGTVHTGAPALDSAVWPDVSSLYEDAFPDAWDPSGAVEILTGQGCLRGEDDVFSCGGSRLSFTFATTIGDPWRRAHFEMIRDDLAQVGIELVGRFLAPSELFADDFFFGGADQWQLMGFPWMFSERPHLGNTRFLCEGTAPNGFGALNVNRYCNEEAERLILETEREPDPQARGELYREADRLYLVDLAVIPLYQRPVTIAWSDSLAGPRPNLSSAALLWNVAAWTGATEVRVGVDRMPANLDPLAPGDARLVLAPVLAGAFGVDPLLRFVPVLIESVDVLAAGGP